MITEDQVPSFAWRWADVRLLEMEAAFRRQLASGKRLVGHLVRVEPSPFGYDQVTWRTPNARKNQSNNRR